MILRPEFIGIGFVLWPSGGRYVAHESGLVSALHCAGADANVTGVLSVGWANDFHR